MNNLLTPVLSDMHISESTDTSVNNFSVAREESVLLTDEQETANRVFVNSSANTIYAPHIISEIKHSINNNDTQSDVKILDEIRTKYVKNLIIGHLNINSLVNKFDALSFMIKDKLDILVLVETKLDDSFPDKQFYIEGFRKPYRLDRNCHGGGVMI